MIPAAGEIWLADAGGETRRRLVFVLSDARFHRLAERAVVAPALDSAPGPLMPWHIAWRDWVVAVNQLATVRIERLLERVDTANLAALNRARRAVHEITS